MNSPTPHGISPRPRSVLAALTALLVALILGLASPALAAGSGNGPDHSHGNASTTGSANDPQPLSNADQKGGGANGQCPGGAYCSTRDGSASQNGRGDTNGNAQAKGKPCAGCVGKADNKNPHGQRPNGSDHNAGYECDRNQGIGQSNPAHTGCTGTTSTGTTPPASGGTTTPPASGGTTTPPASGGTTTPPTSGGTTSPPVCTGPMTAGSAGSAGCTPPTTGGTTSPPTCSGPMPANGTGNAGCGTVTSGPLAPVIVPSPQVQAATSSPAAAAGPAAATAASETVAPRSASAAAPVSNGVLPNTGAPANALLILLGALAMLGCGAWVVRRKTV